MPGAGFQHKAAEWNYTLQQMANVPHDFVKEQMVTCPALVMLKVLINYLQAAGTAEPSFTAKLLEVESLSADEEDVIKWAAASLYSGGADTVRVLCFSTFNHDILTLM
jgi:hypothetical protein